MSVDIEHILSIEEKLSNIDVVILCGGRGSRLQPVVSDRPKAMAVLRGRPFLEWQLLSLREAGFMNIVLCTGYMAESIREYFGEGQRLGLHLRYSDEQEPLGTGGALRHAWPFIKTDPILVLNGDSWCAVNMAQLIRFHKTNTACGTLALTVVPNSQRFGQVAVGKHEEIVGFLEKSCLPSTGWINAGMYVLSRALIESIPQDACISLEHDIFPQWVNRLYGYSGEFPFFDIGTPVSYVEAEEQFDQVFQGFQWIRQAMESNV